MDLLEYPQPLPIVGVGWVVLVATFVVSALTKTIRRIAWFETLGDHVVSVGTRRLVAVGVPLLELTTVVLLWLRPRGGALLAIVLLLAFSAAILRARTLHGDRLRCGCFGGSKQRDYRMMLARNAVLVFLASVVLVELRVGEERHVAPLILIVAGIAAGMWTVSELTRLLSVATRR